MNQSAMTKLTFILAFGAALPCVQAQKRTTDRLTDEADAVVVGEVQSGRQSGYSVAFVLSISRTLKGDFPPGTLVNVTWSCALRAQKDLKGNYGLWFLRKTAGSQWTLQPVLQGQFPFEAAYFPVPRASLPVPIAASPQPRAARDLIAAELVGALQVRVDRSQLHRLALGLLGIGESAVTPGLYRALRASGDPELRFLGLAGRLRADDVSALGEIANNVDLIPGLEVAGFVLDAIEARRDADPAAIGYLGRIASSTNRSVQRSAAEALKYIHTRDTLPFLAQLLDSNEAKTREAAMTGLSRFVDNLPIATPASVPSGRSLVPQGPQPYRTAGTDKYSLSTRRLDQAYEAEYLRFWRSWWASMKDRLMAAPGPPAASAGPASPPSAREKCALPWYLQGPSECWPTPPPSVRRRLRPPASNWS